MLAPFVLPGERIRAAARAREAGPGARRARWKCWRPRRSASPPPARISAAAADATISTRRTSTSCAKRAILEEELRRLGKIEPPGRDRGGRGRAVGIPQSRAVARRGRPARISRERARTSVCAIDRCPIASPEINEAIAALSEMLRDPRWPRFVRSLEIFTDETAGAVQRARDRAAGGAALLRLVRRAHSGAGGGRARLPRRVPRQQQFVFPGEPVS